MTEDQEDQLLNNATHAVADEFAEQGIELESDELYAINDFLTNLLVAIQAKQRWKRTPPEHRNL